MSGVMHRRSPRTMVTDGHAAGAAPALRCAIYTRKSTENGLEQAFNSLDNQRESAEAFIKSQAHEGWRLLPDAYDDGGYSGGSLDRPAIQRLLAEVRAKRVDVIVVYKVDRLTRSLADFAKLVELFDAHGVSFVSVTQAFNTTTSMGRLTLNVLLSFAQFEREVTGERIRDKVAACKKKGMRMGGPVALGYRVEDKRLVADPQEAPQIELIFRRSLELGSLDALLGDLRERGIMTKVSARRDGTMRGGIPFNKSGLGWLLHNRTYIGEIIHHGQHYRGQHAPIIDRALFDAVQAKLADRARNEGSRRLQLDALLRGLLFDADGRPMRPSLTNKGGLRYRYYVTVPSTDDKAKRSKQPITRVAAPALEVAVLTALDMTTPQNTDRSTPNVTNAHVGEQHELLNAPTLSDELRGQIERVVLGRHQFTLHRRPATDDQLSDRLTIPFTPARSHPHRAVIGDDAKATIVQPIRTETRARLLSGIARARSWLDELLSGRVSDLAAIAARERCSLRHIRSIISLAFLAPTLVEAAVAGTLPERSGITALMDMPAAWNAQTEAVG